MGIFERYLSIWVGLGIVAGVALGSAAPGIFSTMADWQVAGVNLPVTLFIWLMIYPMMLQIDFSSIRQIHQRPQGLVLTIVINWLVKPFSMAALGWLFFRVVFAGFVDPQTANEYIAGMILLGVAPCTAMVFVWSQLTRGDANYTLVQVSLNDVIMVFAFAPIAAFLLGVTDISVPWDTLVISVVLYVLVPLGAGLITRSALNKKPSGKAIDGLVAALKPFAISGLIATVVLLFGFQATTILSNPVAVVLIAIPLLVQTYGIFVLTYGAARALKLPYNVAAPASLIGTSNFFELAVAVAISLFGLNSGAALATVVGVLVEVPVMLTLVAVCNRTQHWFPSKEAA